MTNLLDWILDLFRDPVKANDFVTDPQRAMQTAGLQNATAAQVQAVAATVAPAAVVQGGGNPVHGLQQAVAQTHGIAFTPQRHTEVASHNATQFASPSNNDFHSPDQQSGANSQVGGVNLGFGDITFGDRTENNASNGGVVNTGEAEDIDATNIDGDGNVVGDENNANTGDISDSNVNIGENNDLDDSGDQTAEGDIISENEAPVVNDVDMSGGNGGSASSGQTPDSGEAPLIDVGIGDGSSPVTGGAGGNGGGITINEGNTNTVGSPVEETPAEPADPPAEQPVDPPVEEPVDPPVEEPADPIVADPPFKGDGEGLPWTATF